MMLGLENKMPLERLSFTEAGLYDTNCISWTVKYCNLVLKLIMNLKRLSPSVSENLVWQHKMF